MEETNGNGDLGGTQRERLNRIEAKADMAVEKADTAAARASEAHTDLIELRNSLTGSPLVASDHGVLGRLSDQVSTLVSAQEAFQRDPGSIDKILRIQPAYIDQENRITALALHQQATDQKAEKATQSQSDAIKARSDNRRWLIYLSTFGLIDAAGLIFTIIKGAHGA